MRRGYAAAIVAASLSLIAATGWMDGAAGQRRGYGRGAGPQARLRNGAGYGGAYGQGAGRCAIGYGPGSRRALGAGPRHGWQARRWWTEAKPANADDRALLEEVGRLHERLWAMNREVASLEVRGEDPSRIAQRREEAATVRAELSGVMQRNQARLLDLGAPAWCRELGGPGRFPDCPYR